MQENAAIEPARKDSNSEGVLCDTQYSPPSFGCKVAAKAGGGTSNFFTASILELIESFSIVSDGSWEASRSEANIKNRRSLYCINDQPSAAAAAVNIPAANDQFWWPSTSVAGASGGNRCVGGALLVHE